MKQVYNLGGKLIAPNNESVEIIDFKQIEVMEHYDGVNQFKDLLKVFTNGEVLFKSLEVAINSFNPTLVFMVDYNLSDIKRFILIQSSNLFEKSIVLGVELLFKYNVSLQMIEIIKCEKLSKSYFKENKVYESEQGEFILFNIETNKIIKGVK